jgi:hypothetical protein
MQIVFGPVLSHFGRSLGALMPILAFLPLFSAVVVVGQGDDLVFAHARFPMSRPRPVSDRGSGLAMIDRILRMLPLARRRRVELPAQCRDVRALYPGMDHAFGDLGFEGLLRQPRQLV